MVVLLTGKEEIAAEIDNLAVDIDGDMILLRQEWSQVKELAESNLASNYANGPDPLPALSNRIAEISRRVKRAHDKRNTLLLRLGEITLAECRPGEQPS